MIAKRFIANALYSFVIQLIMALLLTFRNPSSAHIYTACAFPLFAFAFIFLTIPILFPKGHRNHVPKSPTLFPYTVIALLNIGIGLQCISVGDSAYIQKILLVGAIVAPIATLAYHVITRNLSPALCCLLAVAALAIIYALLIITARQTGAADTGSTTTSIQTNNESIQIILLTIPLFIFLLSNLYALPELKSIPVLDPQFIIYLSSLAILGINLLFFIYLNELGTAAVMIICFFVITFFYLSLWYTLTNILGATIVFSGAWLCIRKAMFAAESGSTNSLIKQLSIIGVKLQSRFNMVGSVFDPTIDAYQITQGRKAILLGGLTGSNLQLHLPVFESDMAFEYLILKLGLPLAIFVLFLLLSLLSYSKYLVNISNQQMRIFSTTLLYAIVSQALLTILGSLGLFIFSGLPILFISQAGSYFALCISELLIIYTLPYTTLPTSPSSTIVQRKKIEVLPNVASTDT